LNLSQVKKRIVFDKSRTRLLMPKLWPPFIPKPPNIRM